MNSFTTKNPRDKVHKEIGGDCFSSVTYVRAYRLRRFNPMTEPPASASSFVK